VGRAAIGESLVNGTIAALVGVFRDLKIGDLREGLRSFDDARRRTEPRQ
jgi:hypothetical protein